MVYLTTVSGGAPYPDLDDRSLHAEVSHRQLLSLPWEPPWSWYPKQLSHVGIGADADMARVWFAGIAKGQERTVLEELVGAVAHHRDVMSPLARDTARQIARPVDLAVLATPDCGRCAAAVRVVHGMALLNPLLRSTAIMLDDIPELTGRLAIYQVPVLFINRRRHDGAMNEWILAQMIQDAAGGQ